MTAPTSPKPPTPADPNDLRTALTKAIDRADPPGGLRAGTPSISVAVLRALLAAHPVPAPVRSGHDIACDADYLNASCICDEISPAPEVCGNCLGHGVETCAAHPVPVSDTRRAADELVEAVARALSRSEHPGVQAYIDARAVLAVLPAPPVVDEAEVQERIAQDIAEAAVDDGMSSDWRYGMRVAAGIARGATR